jgi:CheY-like chemotaxis protein
MPNGGTLIFETDNIALDEHFCQHSEFDIVAGTFIRIRVSDSGVGMNKNQLNHLFEPFFTTKPEGEGTGMGLASVYGTIVSHHGAITVESTVGKGTSLIIDLPTSDESYCKMRTTTNTRRTKAVRILLVDDDENILKTTERLLQRRGHDVMTASDGKAAVARYQESWKDIDLVILDMNMPTMNGKDAFLAMREICPQIKAILSTGYSEDTLAQEMLKAGIIRYIEKPFHISELEAIIQQALSL